jgi:hypothetical protein
MLLCSCIYLNAKLENKIKIKITVLNPNLISAALHFSGVCPELGWWFDMESCVEHMLASVQIQPQNPIVVFPTSDGYSMIVNLYVNMPLVNKIFLYKPPEFK